MSGGMSGATIDSATRPIMPPTSAAGTMSTVPPPAQPSMARGPAVDLDLRKPEEILVERGRLLGQHDSRRRCA